MNQFVLGVSLSFAMGLLPSGAIAQVDPASGSSTNVNSSGGVITITGGTPNGTNLFHSFERFSPHSDQVIFDNSAVNAQNIFGRVLGSTPSFINGQIDINGTSANLYLINPNGFTFGTNARLGTGINSFSATTATSILFPDAEFTTINPDLSATLSLRVPNALEFRSENGTITIAGSGHHLGGVTVTDLRSDTTTTNSLGVGLDQTLTIVGSGVELQGGNLFADSGRVEVGSVGTGTVIRINPDLSLDYSNVTAFQDIDLLGAASIDTSGIGGGEIQVQGQNIRLSEGSNIVSITEGAEAGEPVTVKAAGQLVVDGFAGFIPTGIVTRNRNDANATGSSGDLDIRATVLAVTGGAQVATGTFRDGGKAGDINISADSVLVSGQNGTPFYGASGIYNRAFGSAPGGTIGLNGNQLIVNDGALISTRAIRSGQSGLIDLKFSEHIQLQNRGQITASTLTASALGNGGAIALATPRLILNNARITAITGQNSRGNAGNITAVVDQVNLSNNSEISSSTFTEGAGGNVDIKADTIALDGVSRIATQVGTGATGDAGRVRIDTRTLTLTNGAQILADTLGTGDGGEVSVIAHDSVTIIGAEPGVSFSGIVTQVEPGATGNGGVVRVKAKTLTLTDGGAITGGTRGNGDAGSVYVDIEEEITIQGQDSAIAARTLTERDAGNLSITTHTLHINDFGEVTVAALNPNGLSGNAGNLTVNAQYIRLTNNATITGSTTSGQGGNLDIKALCIIMLFDSEISTTAGTANLPGDGGNININTGAIAGLFNSDIASNSFRGRGGRIVINAQGIFGLEFRLQRTAENDITAISLVNPVLNGEVVLNTPDIDPTQALIDVPIVESPEVVERVCTVRPGTNEDQDGQFSVSGRAVPTGPLGVSSSGQNESIIAPLFGPDQELEAALIPLTPTTPNNPLIAQGWGRNAEGQLVFTGATETPAPQALLVSAIRCR